MFKNQLAGNLKQKVLDHIKQNFISEISNKGVGTDPNKIQKNNPEITTTTGNN